jgi:hypothetical protein
MDLVLWRDRVGGGLTPAQCLDFDAALQEIRFNIMADGEATGARAIEEALREKIAGRTVRQVLQIGYESKLARLNADSEKLDSFIRRNAQLRPVDGISADFLVDVHDEQVSRLRAMDEESEEIGRKLDLLLQRPHSVRRSRAPLPEAPKPQAPAGPVLEARSLDSQPVLLGNP